MNLNPTDIAGLLPFELRYELRRQRWCDGPYGSWEAFDRVLEREIVLNIAWGYSHVPSFIRSAKVASSLRHTGFLPVYDLGIIGGTTPYYTTPPVREKPLGHLLRESQDDGPPPANGFPLVPLVGALRDACRALDYAHHRGLLHLDLHPDSLLIGGDYHLILDVDGWSEARAGDGGESGGFRIVGRPNYMSPEQINEAGPGIGPATDVFGLGGILHFILFGKPPNHLEGTPNVRDVIKAIAGRAFEPRRPGTLRPGMRTAARWRLDGLVGICLKTLAYEPEARYRSATEMGDALDEWLDQDRRAWWEIFWRPYQRPSTTRHRTMPSTVPLHPVSASTTSPSKSTVIDPEPGS
jgi:eukaryotic-like serine/threonine-protein kinase